MSSDGPKLVPASAIPNVPDWVYSPESFIKKIIVRFILGLILGAVATTRDAINTVFSIITIALDDAGTAISGTFAASTDGVLSGFTFLQDMVFQTAQALGPLGPLFIAVVVVVTVVLTVRLIRALMDSVPILSGIETFFR
jgi:hypothetical protein